MSLTENQLSNLVQFSQEWVKTLKVETGDLSQSEINFTSKVMLPQLRNYVSNLGKAELYVRGDGGPSVQPLVFEEIFLYPDLTIVSSLEKYIAFEIKILREQDPGGALTKAIGQSVMYGTLGYRHSFGLVFDARRLQGKAGNCTWNRKLLSGETSEVHFFSSEA